LRSWDYSYAHHTQPALLGLQNNDLGKVGHRYSLGKLQMRMSKYRNVEKRRGQLTWERFKKKTTTGPANRMCTWWGEEGDRCMGSRLILFSGLDLEHVHIRAHAWAYLQGHTPTSHTSLHSCETCTHRCPRKSILAWHNESPPVQATHQQKEAYIHAHTVCTSNKPTHLCKCAPTMTRTKTL
jgi:hypothetical protein